MEVIYKNYETDEHFTKWPVKLEKINAYLRITDAEEARVHKTAKGEEFVFSITATQKFVTEFHAVTNWLLHAEIPITAETAQDMRQNYGVEQHRLDRLVEPFISGLPLLAIAYSDEEPYTYNIIDGSHRYVKQYELGFITAKAHLFLPSLWRQMVMPVKVPPETYTAFSGIK